MLGRVTECRKRPLPRRSRSGERSCARGLGSRRSSPTSGLEFSETDEANGDVATRAAGLFVGLGLVEGLRTSRLPDLAAVIVVGVRLFPLIDVAMATLDQRSVATAEKGLPID